MTTPSNPPAFPVNFEAWTDHTGAVINTGMTLRDWFAGMAQQYCPINVYEHEKAAEWCYQRADAMLAEREKGQQ